MSKYLPGFYQRSHSALSPEQLVGQQAFENFLAESASQVQGWPVQPADPASADRVAVTVVQPGSQVQRYAQLIRWNLRLLGPKWALQLFYGRDEEKAALQLALGNSPAIVWTPISLEGQRRESITLNEYNWLRLTMNFWRHIKQEHVLIFEADSMVLKGGGCVEGFFAYDYVGAPWRYGIGPPVGGNGGFTLRRRSKSAQAVQLPEAKDLLGPNPSWNYVAEDLAMSQLFQYLGANIAPADQAMHFSVETIDFHAPCGFHKTWLHHPMSMSRFMDQARQAMASMV